MLKYFPSPNPKWFERHEIESGKGVRAEVGREWNRHHSLTVTNQRQAVFSRKHQHTICRSVVRCSTSFLALTESLCSMPAIANGPCNQICENTANNKTKVRHHHKRYRFQGRLHIFENSSFHLLEGVSLPGEGVFSTPGPLGKFLTL